MKIFIKSYLIYQYIYLKLYILLFIVLKILHYFTYIIYIFIIIKILKNSCYIIYCCVYMCIKLKRHSGSHVALYFINFFLALPPINPTSKANEK